MAEGREQLLKELLQKKLAGNLTVEESLILADLVAHRHDSSDEANAVIPTMSNFMGELDSLRGSFDEMAGKIGERSSNAAARQSLAEKEKKS